MKPRRNEKHRLCKIWGGQIRCIMGNVEMSYSVFQPRFSGSLAARRDELRCSLFQAHTQWGRRESKRHAKVVFTLYSYDEPSPVVSGIFSQ